jgi:hypothetical protein
VNLSAFPNLQEFRCENNNITAISGWNNNISVLQVQTNLLSGSFINLTGLSNITVLWIYNNQYNGTFPADFNNLTSLQNFRCEANRLTGSIPSLSAFPNLRFFKCHNQQGTTKLTGSIPELTGCPLLEEFECHSNQLGGTLPVFSGLNNLRIFNCFTQPVNGITGTIPDLNLPSLQEFRIENNKITGTIPSLNNIPNIQLFSCFQNSLTGTIPNLNSCGVLTTFWCYNQQGPGGIRLRGSIPSLSGCSSLVDFRCHANQLSSFDGGSVSNTLDRFEAWNNLLPQSSVDLILSAIDTAAGTPSTRLLNIGGIGNSAPSYTSGVTTVSAGNLFTTLGTTVTAACTNHNHPNGSLVTITGLQTVFTGTFAISSINANQFRYTVATNSPTLVTGSGTATMRRTTNDNDGFRFYQNLARFGRLATTPGTVGFPWTVTVNLP